jgi:hypothetical protein
MRRLFSRKKVEAVADDLPAEVASAIETASVIARRDAEKVLVQFRGLGMFSYSLEGAIAFIRESFPTLNDGQVARAIRFLDSHVSKRVDMQARHAAEMHGGRASRWSDWRPLRITE